MNSRAEKFDFGPAIEGKYSEQVRAAMLQAKVKGDNPVLYWEVVRLAS